MMGHRSAKVLIATAALLALVVSRTATAEEAKDEGKTCTLAVGKVEEAEAKTKLEAPNFGYVGQLSSFVANGSGHAGGLLVVHNHPDTKTHALGHTKLTYKGAKRLGNVDGYVFETQWDGKQYPSKIFFSSEKVYMGGGVNAYVAADFREDTGWAWKFLPLKRMNLVANGTTKSTSSKGTTARD